MKNKEKSEAVGAGVMLIGLGLLFLLRIGFWPWILVVVAAAGLPVALSGEHGWKAWEGFFWMAGLAILFATGLFWPGILVLVGRRALAQALWEPAKKKEPFAVDEDEQDGIVDVPLANTVRSAPNSDTAPLDEAILVEIDALDDEALEAELEASIADELEENAI